jgi:ABC-2 type transport system permease protein
MLTLRRQLFFNTLRQSPSSALLGLLLGLALVWGTWAGVSWFLHFLAEQLSDAFRFIPFGKKLAEQTQKVIADRSLGSLLLLLSTSGVLSALPNAVAVLYASEDLPLLLSLPQKAWRVFMSKVIEVFSSTVLLPALLTLPALYAFGYFYHASPFYYIGATLLALALFSFPVVIGVAIALPLVRFAPAGRAREWSAAVGAVLGGLLVLVLRALRPEALVKTNFADPEALDRFLQTFRNPAAPFLPSSLASKALNGLIVGKVLPEFWIMLGLSLALLLLAGLVAGFAYQQGWVRALEGTVRERGILRPNLIDRLGGANGAWALWGRDLRLFFRDANQSAQLILVGVLVLLYVTSLQYMPLDNDRFKTVVGFMHLAFQGFVISGVGVRLAYPLYSLEGQGYWMIQTGPVSHRTLLLTRFALALLFLVPLGLLLGWLSPQVLHLGTDLTQISILLGLAAAITSAGLGVGLGAAFPRFDAANPAEVPIGLGGFLYMGLTLLHSAVLVVLASRPVYLMIAQRQGQYLQGPEGPLWLLLLAALTVLPLMVALWYGHRRMNQLA